MIYLAPDDPETSINRKMTKSEILVSCCFIRLYNIYTPCYVNSDEKGVENAARKTGQDMKW
jgi:hypothetical protein